jgi:ribonuclease T2
VTHHEVRGRAGRVTRGLLAGMVAALSLLAGAGPVAARDDGCVLDNCADKRPPVSRANSDGPQPSGASRPGDFDFYVLSLSWSSGFCATGGAAKARTQCAPGSNLGFVVHGLWPQYDTGFPQDCGPAGRFPSRIALDSVKGLYPDEGLARYEWRKHGTCSGKSPTDYFADVRRARDAVVVPQPFLQANGDQSWAPIDILRAFEAANPRLRPGMSAIVCAGGVLEEVRLCLSKDLRDFQPCPEVVRRTCRARELRVPAPL